MGRCSIHRWVALVSVLLIGCATTVAWGQEEKKERRGGREGQPGRQGRGFGMGGSDILGLLEAPEVQKHLKITDDEGAYLKLLRDESREEFEKMRQALDPDLSREEIFRKMGEFQRKRRPEIEKQVTEIIGKDRVKRLKQVQLQVGGLSALLSPFGGGANETADELKITQEQKDKAGEVFRSSREEMGSIFRDAAGDREAMMKAMEEFRKKQEEKLTEILTDEQKKKWKEMQGEPIDFRIQPRPFQFRGPDRKGGDRKKGGDQKGNPPIG